MSGPVLPVCRVWMRFERKAGVWHPCAESDSRGSMVITVDSLGRPVISVFSPGLAADGSGPSVIGYKLAVANDSMDADKIKNWMQANPKLEVVK